MFSPAHPELCCNCSGRAIEGAMNDSLALPDVITWFAVENEVRRPQQRERAAVLRRLVLFCRPRGADPRLELILAALVRPRCPRECIRRAVILHDGPGLRLEIMPPEPVFERAAPARAPDRPRRGHVGEERGRAIGSEAGRPRPAPLTIENEPDAFHV